jgi:hypothetical protein
MAIRNLLRIVSFTVVRKLKNPYGAGIIKIAKPPALAGDYSECPSSPREGSIILAFFIHTQYFIPPPLNRSP